MTSDPACANIDVRIYSQTASLKQIAVRLGEQLGVYYEPGEHFRARGEKILNATSDEYYLTTKDIEETDLAAIRRHVSNLVQFIEGNGYLRSLLDINLASVVISVAIFGVDPITFEDLHLDLTPFGDRIGLVIYDYSELDYNGRAARQFKIGHIP